MNKLGNSYDINKMLYIAKRNTIKPKALFKKKSKTESH